MKIPDSLATLMPSVTEMVFSRLNEKLFYHNLAHTQQVVGFSMQLAEKAALAQEEIKILYAAAVLHDSGYGKKYKTNEGVAAMLAGKVLPDFGFSTTEIEQVREMILATNLVLSPNNKLEMLLADADMGYLGTDDYVSWSNKLYKEWEAMEISPELRKNWLQTQISFLSNHTYFTPEAIALFDAGKQKNLKQIKSLVEWPF